MNRQPCAIECGDFEYVIRHDKGSSTHTFRYVVVRAPYRGIPRLAIRRERLLDKIAGDEILVGNGDRTWSVTEFRGGIEFLSCFFAERPEHLTASLHARGGIG